MHTRSRGGLTTNHNSALVTDFYQLAMLNTYFDLGMEDTAVFELFVRRLPPQRNFLMTAGLAQVVDFLDNLAFEAEELEYLASDKRLHRGFIDHLAEFRFTGDVHAMPEGTVFFAEEPVLRITAPISQAQLVESRVINILHMQTLVASKASRFVIAAEGRRLVDFGLRCSHGAEAGVFAARASYLAGLDGTATVMAGMRFGVPTLGTMAHSFIQTHDDEAQAFANFAHSQPGNVTLLVDTYDIEAGTKKVVALAAQLKNSGEVINAVRIDSGDLGECAKIVRDILDQGGYPDIGIMVSGSLDEHRVAALVRDGAPVDGFGVGTNLDVSPDAPVLDCVYKLQEYAGQARRKRSANKHTWPGAKQVYRRFSDAGVMLEDTVTLADDPHTGEPLLRSIMKNGERLEGLPDLATIRAHAAKGLNQLPKSLRQLNQQPAYPVTISNSVRELAKQVDAARERRHQGT